MLPSHRRNPALAERENRENRSSDPGFQMTAAPTGLSILAQIGRFGGHYWLGFFGRFGHHFVGLRNAHDLFDGCFAL